MFGEGHYTKLFPEGTWTCVLTPLYSAPPPTHTRSDCVPFSFYASVRIGPQGLCYNMVSKVTCVLYPLSLLYPHIVCCFLSELCTLLTRSAHLFTLCQARGQGSNLCQERAKLTDEQ